MFRKRSANLFVQLISSKYKVIHVSAVMPKKQSKKVTEGKEEKKPLNPISLDKSGNITVKVLAKPGANINSITDISEEGVGVQINAPPVDGEANTELIKYLSSILDIRKSDVQLARGSRSRQKTIIITQSKSVSIESITEKLKSAIKS